MDKPVRASDTPIGVDVEEGKTYFWCSCGKSGNQPLCDGSHGGTDFKPLAYKAQKTAQSLFLWLQSDGESTTLRWQS